MADRLAGLGAPVSEKDLIHNIVRGLNSRLHHAIPHITLRRRLPSFVKTRSMLQLEEQRIVESEKMQAAATMVTQSATAGTTATPSPAHLQAAATLVAHTAPSTPASPSDHGRPQTPATAPPSNNGGRYSPPPSGAKKKKKKGAPSPQAPPPGFWPSVNTWTGMVQAWPFQAPRATMTGVLGARLSAPSPQAHVRRILPGGSTTARHAEQHVFEPASVPW